LSKRVEPELPTITIDQDQVKVAREPAIKSQKVDESKHTVKTKKPSSMIKALLLLMPYVALAATAWYFYQQQINVTRSLESSSQRIQQLENQLSATGEEMGESTIALKVKLEAIGEKTELLLSEMDKLWASAWRKNQKEIKELNSTSIKIVQQQDKTIEAMSLQSNTINELKDKITATEFSVNSVSEQIMALNSVKTEIKSLSSALSTLDANAKSRDKQQMFTATTVNEFDTSLQLLLERMERLEAILASKS
jgi:chromosome segregation ATPase